MKVTGNEEENATKNEEPTKQKKSQVVGSQWRTRPGSSVDRIRNNIFLGARWTVLPAGWKWNDMRLVQLFSELKKKKTLAIILIIMLKAWNISFKPLENYCVILF